MGEPLGYFHSPPLFNTEHESPHARDFTLKCVVAANELGRVTLYTG